MVLYHVVRFVGFYFLALYAEGRLPYAFAVPGGWGDNITAAGALLVGLAFLPIKSKGSWWAVLLWNVFGLVDILMVASTALRLALTEPGSMAELTKLPLNLLPTFIVPLIVTTHIFIFIRLAKLRRV